MLLALLLCPGSIRAQPPFATSSQRPRILPLRAEEDWSALVDPNLRTSPFDALKRIRLGDDAFTLTLGADARLVYELFINEAFGAVPQDDSGSWLLRTMIHGDVWIGPHFRVFAQLKSGLETGRDTGPGPFDEDWLDLHQGFVQFAIGDPRQRTQDTVVLRVGRQELLYGGGRLFDVRDGPTIRRSFDAVRAQLNTPYVLAEALFGIEVPIRRGVFDDGGGERPVTWGTHFTTRPEWLAPFGFDAYYFGVAQRGLVYVDGAGDETRHTAGVRWWSRTPEFRHDIELNYQFGALDGNAGSREIRAWGVAASVAYVFDPTHFRGEISLDGGVTSGDGARGDAELGTFRSPFPNLRFAGVTTRVGPGNLWGMSPGLGLDAIPRVLHLQFVARFFWRTELSDAPYSPAGFPLETVPMSAQHFVGAGAALIVVGTLNEYTTVHVLAELFEPSNLLVAEARPSGFIQAGARFAF